MKKLLAIMAFAVVLTACNNDAETTTTTEDSIRVADSIRVTDSINNARMNDTMKMPNDTMPKK